MALDSPNSHHHVSSIWSLFAMLRQCGKGLTYVLYRPGAAAGVHGMATKCLAHACPAFMPALLCSASGYEKWVTSARCCVRVPVPLVRPFTPMQGEGLCMH